MKNVLATFLFLSVVLILTTINGLTAGEINLKPSIGLDALPSDDEKMCEIQFVIDDGTFNTKGIYRGMSIPDFTLYTPEGEAVNARTLLETGKPLAIMLGSYTCPVFHQAEYDHDDESKQCRGNPAARTCQEQRSHRHHKRY